MRYYPIRLTAPAIVAGDTPFLDVAGNFVRYDEESSGAVANKISFTTDTGEFFTLKPGQAALLEREFKRIALLNQAGLSTLSGFVAIGGRGAVITDSNIQGSVIVLGSIALSVTQAGAPQGADKSSSDGKAFAGFSFAGPGVGVVSGAQIFNPVASGRRLYLDAVRVVFDAGDICNLKYATVALPTLFATGGLRKSDGSLVAGIAQFRGDNTGASAGFNVDELAQDVANKTDRVVFPAPYIFDPGTGMTVQRTGVNKSVVAFFEYREF